MVSPQFPGVTVDNILRRLIEATITPPFIDHRDAVSLWGRPPSSIRNLLGQIQEHLIMLSPNLWLMPLHKLHISLLEIAHNTTPAIVDERVKQLRPHFPKLLAYPQNNPTHLFRPQLACDTSSLVVKFLPVTGTNTSYTYHHLRRDLFDQVSTLGIIMCPRYVVPSAHITVARFIDNVDFEMDGKTVEEKMRKWWKLIDNINVWLASLPDEKGMWTIDNAECRTGTQWYGGGESVGDARFS
jgi:hypothetical protein